MRRVVIKILRLRFVHAREATTQTLIAQEELAVEKEFGYGDVQDNMLITTVNSDGDYGMKYQRLVPILINAVKELSAKVTALEAK